MIIYVMQFSFSVKFSQAFLIFLFVPFSCQLLLADGSSGRQSKKKHKENTTTCEHTCKSSNGNEHNWNWPLPRVSYQSDIMSNISSQFKLKYKVSKMFSKYNALQWFEILRWLYRTVLIWSRFQRVNQRKRC